MISFFSKRAYYGIDAPGIIRNFLIIGIVCLIISFMISSYSGFFITLVKWSSLAVGIYLLIAAFWMLFASLYGKYHQRDTLLELVHWKGNEIILDVGCGRGLLLIGAAKKLITGKAIGIDTWQAADLSNNSKQETLQNAHLEHVSDNVEVIDADARSLPFPAHTFDVIVSSLVIHNIPDAQEREKAIKEMARVLKPTGIILIQDFQYTQDYEQILSSLGFKVERTRLFWWIFPPVRIVKAQKTMIHNFSQI